MKAAVSFSPEPTATGRDSTPAVGSGLNNAQRGLAFLAARSRGLHNGRNGPGPLAAMADNFDPYLHWLGIRDRQRPPNHYRLLGVELFEDDPDVISNAGDRQMAHVRTFQTGPIDESAGGPGDAVGNRVDTPLRVLEDAAGARHVQRLRAFAISHKLIDARLNRLRRASFQA